MGGVGGVFWAADWAAALRIQIISGRSESAPWAAVQLQSHAEGDAWHVVVGESLLCRGFGRGVEGPAWHGHRAGGLGRASRAAWPAAHHPRLRATAGKRARSSHQLLLPHKFSPNPPSPTTAGWERPPSVFETLSPVTPQKMCLSLSHSTISPPPTQGAHHPKLPSTSSTMTGPPRPRSHHPQPRQ